MKELKELGDNDFLIRPERQYKTSKKSLN